MRRIKAGLVSGVWVLLLFVALFGVVLNVLVVKASGTIYIRADGSIDPPTAPISTNDNITYTFTDNIFDSIVVERSNITIDGHKHTIGGIEYIGGFYLCGITNVTVETTNIEGFYWGVFLNLSSGCNILGNNITGIYLDSSSNNIIYGNNITRIQAWFSNYTNITENNIRGEIYLSESNFATITRNRIENLWPNYDPGIYLSSCDNSVLFENNVTNSRRGIDVSVSSNCTLSRNRIESVWRTYNFGIYGSELSDFMHSIDLSNFINGKPIYYLVNQTDLAINPTTCPEVGYLGLINCDNITVEGLTLERNYEGLLMAYTNNSRIANNMIENNGYGVFIIHSHKNLLFGNTITNYQLDDQRGIYLDRSSNNSICRNTIYNNVPNINIWGSFGNTISENTVTDPIELYSSSDNTLSENILTYGAFIYLSNSSDNTIFGHCFYSERGFRIYQSSNNQIHHNNFFSGANSVEFESVDSVNIWDDGFPSGGNYWSDYTGLDLDPDGVGDTEYAINADNIDHYPLMGMFSDSNATLEYHVQTVCISTLSDFQFNGTAIMFNVTGVDGTTGFCRICIPTGLMNVTYRVFVNGTEVLCNLLPCSNETYSYLYFNYTHSTQEVIIIREFPLFLILPLFMTATLIAVILCRRKRISIS